MNKLKPTELLKLTLTQKEFDNIFFERYPRKTKDDTIYRCCFEHFTKGIEVKELALDYGIGEHQIYTIVRGLRRLIHEHYHLDFVSINIFMPESCAIFFDAYQDHLLKIKGLKKRQGFALGLQELIDGKKYIEECDEEQLKGYTAFHNFAKSFRNKL